MAYEFVAASSQTISGSISDIPPPRTIHVNWQYLGTPTSRFAWAIDSTTSPGRLQLQTTNNLEPMVTAVRSDGSVFQTAGTAIAASTWYSMTIKQSATNNRQLYTNGSLVGTGPTDVTVTINNLTIGTRIGATIFWNGYLSDLAIWNESLTDDEIVGLSKGFKPFRVRPQSLQLYIPLIRNIQDVRGVVSLTSFNGPTPISHPRMY
jgi:hypothetical protein